LRILSQQQQQHFLSPTIAAGNNNNYNIDNQQQQQQASLQLQQEEHKADWLRFWIVRGAVQAAKVWLAWWTPLWLHSTLFHLEVLFYLWIYIMPYLQPESISTNGKKYYELPEGRPLQVLHDVYVQPAVEFMHDTISGAVPRDAWETYVVANVRRVLSALVLVWMLSQETADAILHGVQEGRSLVVPAVTLFMPYFITAYGVTYVQYGLSMQKSSLAITMTTIQQSQQQQQHGNDNSKSSSSSSSSCQRWLSYWVLHCALVAILSRLQGLLWWIPFSTHAIFVVWCALSIPRNVDYVFHHLVCDELRAFGILPPTYNYNSNNGSSSGIGSNDNSDDKNDAVVVAAWQETKTAKCLQWIWERLPKANNSNENDADDYYQQQQDDLFASFSNSTSNDNHDDDDDGDTPMQGDEDGNAAPDSQETPLGAESEQDGDDDDVMDTNELNDDDYVPPTSSSCSTRRHVGVTGVAAAAEASSSSLTSSSVDVSVRPRSTRAVRQSRRNNL
jgi:TB2/DP1, HVA22 family